ncbi:hypothetical protein MCEMRE20_00157 [Candidatus Nanopelagicaceae bacterium]
MLLTPIQNFAHASLTFAQINLPSLGAASISTVVQSRNGSTIVLGTSGGNIWISKNAGTSWIEQSASCTESCTSAPSAIGFWPAIGLSPDGRYLAAGDSSTSGTLWTAQLSDTKTVWTARTGPGNEAWRSVEISDDGTRIAAVGDKIGSSRRGVVAYSGDGGANWGWRATSGVQKRKIVASNDLRAIAGIFADDTLPIASTFSNDWGSKWQESIPYQHQALKAFAGSALIDRMIGVESRTVFTSTSSGLSWERVDAISGSHYWVDASISGDGSHMVALNDAGRVYLTKDAGDSWSSGDNVGGTGEFRNTSISEDGSSILVTTASELWRANLNDLPSISIDVPAQTGVIDHAISPIQVLNVGGAATFTISPALPTGIKIDPYLGIVSGVPTETSSEKTYTITAKSIATPSDQSTATFTLSVISTYVPVSQLVNLYGVIKTTKGVPVGNATIQYVAAKTVEPLTTYSDENGNYNFLVTPGPGKIRFISYTESVSVTSGVTWAAPFSTSSHRSNTSMPRYLSLSGDVVVPAGMSGLNQDLTIPSSHSVKVLVQKNGTPPTPYVNKRLSLVGSYNCNVAFLPGATHCEWGDPLYSGSDSIKTDSDGYITFQAIDNEDLVEDPLRPVFITVSGGVNGYTSLFGNSNQETITATSDEKFIFESSDTSTVMSVNIHGNAPAGKKITWCPSPNAIDNSLLGFYLNSCNLFPETVTAIASGDGTYSLKVSPGSVCLKMEMSDSAISTIGCVIIPRGVSDKVVNLRDHGLTMKTVNFVDGSDNPISNVNINGARDLTGVTRYSPNTYDSDLLKELNFSSQYVECTGLVETATYNSCRWTPYRYYNSESTTSLSIPVLTDLTKLKQRYREDTQYNFIASANTLSDMSADSYSNKYGFKGQQDIVRINPLSVPDSVTVTLPALKTLYGIVKDKSDRVLRNVALFYTPDGSFHYDSPYYGFNYGGNRIRVVSDSNGHFAIPNMPDIPGTLEIYTNLSSPESLISPSHGQSNTRSTDKLPSSLQIVAHVDMSSSSSGSRFLVELPTAHRVKIHVQSFTLGTPEAGASVSLQKQSLACKKTINSTFQSCSIAPVNSEWQRTDANGDLITYLFETADMDDSYVFTAFDRVNSKRIATNTISSLSGNKTLSIVLPDAPLAPRAIEEIPLAQVITLEPEIDPAPTPSPLPSSSPPSPSTPIDVASEVITIDATSPSDLPTITPAEDTPANEVTVAVAWDPPISDGGATITDYEVTIEDITTSPETFLRSNRSSSRNAIAQKRRSFTVVIPLSAFKTKNMSAGKFKVSTAPAGKSLRRTAAKQRFLVAEVKFVKNRIYRVSVAAINNVGTGANSKVKIDLKTTSSPSPSPSPSGGGSGGGFAGGGGSGGDVTTTPTPTASPSATVPTPSTSPAPVSSPSQSPKPDAASSTEKPIPTSSPIDIGSSSKPTPMVVSTTIKLANSFKKLEQLGVMVSNARGALQYPLSTSTVKKVVTLNKPVQILLPSVKKGTKLTTSLVINGKYVPVGSVVVSKSGVASLPPFRFTKAGTYTVIIQSGKQKRSIQLVVRK